MIYKIATCVLVLVLIVLAVLVPRIVKDIQKKRSFDNTYAIQNVGNGLCLRPLNAGYENGVPLIQYAHHNWECITWEIIKTDGDNILLMNLFSERSFQPEGNVEQGAVLHQQSMDGTKGQLWQLQKQVDVTYLIKMADRDLYITSPSDEQDARIELQPLRGDKSQKWRLVPQTPIV